MGQRHVEAHSMLILNATPELGRWHSGAPLASEAAHGIKGTVNPRRPKLVWKVGEGSEKADTTGDPRSDHRSRVSADRQRQTP